MTIVCYGCGRFAHERLIDIQELGFSIAFFVDKNFAENNKYIGSYKVYDKKKLIACVDSVDCILITTTIFIGDEIFVELLEAGVPEEKIKHYDWCAKEMVPWSVVHGEILANTVSAKSVATKVQNLKWNKLYTLEGASVSVNLENTHYQLYDSRGTYLWETHIGSCVTIDSLTKLREVFSHQVAVENEIDYCELNDEVFIPSIFPTRNYWHFVFEVMGDILLMEEFGFRGRYLLGWTESNEEIIKLFGIESARVVWLNVTERNSEINKSFKFFKISKMLKFGGWNPECCYANVAKWGRKLRASIISKCGTDYPKRIYVKRITNRKWLNAEDALKQYGFTTIIPENYSVAEQAALFANANIVFSAHGANSTNSIFMKEGAFFVETFGREWIMPCCLQSSLQNKIRYFMLVERTNTFHINDKRSQGALSDYVIPEELVHLVMQQYLASGME